jgi:putative effector of murein hydrolase LrgA (UPF0299 family)
MSAIYALTIVLLIYAAGDVIAAVTKAKFPSSVARGAIVLIGLWIGLIPKNTLQPVHHRRIRHDGRHPDDHHAGHDN